MPFDHMIVHLANSIVSPFARERNPLSSTMRNFTEASKFSPSPLFCVMVRLSASMILGMEDGPYQDWFLRPKRDIMYMHRVHELVITDAIDVLAHFEVMRGFAEEIDSNHDIKNRDIWTTYIRFAVAKAFATHVMIVPGERGCAQRAEDEVGGVADWSDGRAGNAEQAGPSTPTPFRSGKAVRK
ncbi:hypothetical protein A0H81_09524 [Grifola frondosa]|uniref:Uncharacterized protein n=1 Tax=Grifola frondosa TaxID=5627 RepID=A0A1C7M1D3_GRIFR|nr:hypothetical protein A0H81_09524 [Grifola frondosa]